MSVHTKPRWLERVARAVVTPEADPEAARSKPAEQAGPRHGPAWPLVLVALGLAVTLAWALVLGWAVLQAVWAMFRLM